MEELLLPGNKVFELLAIGLSSSAFFKRILMDFTLLLWNREGLLVRFSTVLEIFCNNSSCFSHLSWIVCIISFNFAFSFSCFSIKLFISSKGSISCNINNYTLMTLWYDNLTGTPIRWLRKFSSLSIVLIFSDFCFKVVLNTFWNISIGLFVAG